MQITNYLVEQFDKSTEERVYSPLNAFEPIFGNCDMLRKTLACIFFQNFIYLPIQYTPLTYTIYITLTNTKDAMRVEKRTILTE